MLHLNSVKGLQVVGGQCRRDFVLLECPHGEASSRTGNRVTAKTTARIGDGGNSCAQKPFGVMTRHFETGRNLESFS